MASQAKISSGPAVLLEYIEGLSCDSESDDDYIMHGKSVLSPEYFNETISHSVVQTFSFKIK